MGFPIAGAAGSAERLSPMWDMERWQEYLRYQPRPAEAAMASEARMTTSPPSVRSSNASPEAPSSLSNRTWPWSQGTRRATRSRAPSNSPARRRGASRARRSRHFFMGRDRVLGMGRGPMARRAHGARPSGAQAVQFGTGALRTKRPAAPGYMGDLAEVLPKAHGQPGQRRGAERGGLGDPRANDLGADQVALE